jgi:nucleoid-associated protein YgaU
MRRWLGGALVSVVLACTALMAGWSPAPALICARPNAAGEVVSEPLAGAKRVRAAAARVRPSPIAPPGPQSKVPDGEEMASSESHSMSNRNDPSSGSLPDMGDRNSVAENPPLSAPAVDRTDPGRIPAQKEILRLETVDFSIRVERPASSGLRDDPDSAVLPASRLDASPTGDPLTHIVVRGDTLWAISQRYLGSPLRYAELAENSRIPDPNLIFPGDVIRFVRKR